MQAPREDALVAAAERGSRMTEEVETIAVRYVLCYGTANYHTTEVIAATRRLRRRGGHMQSTTNVYGAAGPGAAGAPAREWGLAILRVVVGVVFIAHGAQKFFMLGIPAVASGFAQGGIPMAPFMAPFIASVELLGGTALTLGLFTRLAALGTACTMLGAMFFVHLKGGFFLPAGIEYTLVLLSASVALILMGPGSFSLDAFRSRSMQPVRTADGRRYGRRAA